MEKNQRIPDDSRVQPYTHRHPDRVTSIANFFVHYEVDDEEVATVLRLAEHGCEDEYSCVLVPSFWSLWCTCNLARGAQRHTHSHHVKPNRCFLE